MVKTHLLKANYQQVCGYKNKEEEEKKEEAFPMLENVSSINFTHCFFPFLIEAYGATWDFWLITFMSQHDQWLFF